MADVHEVRFIHADVHPMNVMCTRTGELLAVIDWGDAGWGDPCLDFVGIPDDHVPTALLGYEVEAPGLLRRDAQARIAWYTLLDALDDLWETPNPYASFNAPWICGSPRHLPLALPNPLGT